MTHSWWHTLARRMSQSRPPKAHASARRLRRWRPMIELLEDRIAPIVRAGAAVPPEVLPGSGFDGVVSIYGNATNTLSTGSLLFAGTYILTAAHNLDPDGDGTANEDVTITFQMAIGDISMTVDVPNIIIHPDWNGDVTDGFDVAVLVIPDQDNIGTPNRQQIAPVTAERFELYRDNDEFAEIATLVGYGVTGTGATAATQPSGTKRMAQNRFEVPGSFIDFTLPDFPVASTLVYDFDDDNGLDPFETLFGPNFDDNGLGDNAEGIAHDTGDPGSPAFTGEGLILGIASYSPTFAPSTDIDFDQHNGTFGELYIYSRSSFFAEFVDDNIFFTDFDLVLDMDYQPDGKDTLPDKITVTRVGSFVQFDINGNQTALYPLDPIQGGRVQTIFIRGSDDDDELTIDFTGGSPFPEVEIVFDGGGGTDRVIASRNKDFTLSDNQLIIDTDVMTLISVEEAKLTAGNLPNTMTVFDWTGTADLDAGTAGDTYDITFAGTGQGVVNINDTGAVGNDSVTVNTLPGGDDSLTLGIVAGKPTVTFGMETVTYLNVEDVTIATDDGNDELTIDLTGGDVLAVAPVTFDGGTGDDHIKVTANTDFDLSDTTLSVDGSSMALVMVEIATLTGGVNADTFDLMDWTGTATLSGLGGDDSFTIKGATGGAGKSITVLGGDNNDQLTVDFSNGDPIPGGGISFDGGTGSDKFIAVADFDFVANNGQISVGAFGTVDLSAASVETANLTGGAGANMFTVTDWNDITLNLDGAGAGDTYDITFKGSGTSVVNVNDTGGAGTDKVTVTGTGGDDAITLALVGGLPTVTRGSEKVTLAGVEELVIDGAGGNDKITVDFTGGDPLAGLTVSFDGGAGTADALDIKADADFELTDGQVKVAGNVVTLAASSFEEISLTGGASGNQFLVENFTGIATLNGGDGNDTFTVKGLAGAGGKLTVNGENNDDLLDIDFTAGDPIPGGGITYDGGAGSDSVNATNDGDFVLNNGTISIGAFGDVSLAGTTVEVANLTGGGSANTFTVTDWISSTANLDGAGAGDTYDITFKGSGSAVVNVSDTGGAGTDKATVHGTAGDDAITLALVGGLPTVTRGSEKVSLAGVEELVIDGAGGNDKITVDFTGGDPTAGLAVSFDGGAGTADEFDIKADADFELTDGQVKVGGSVLTLVATSFEQISLTGGASGNQFLVEDFTGIATLNGGDGNDTFTIKGLAGGGGKLTVNGENNDDLIALDFTAGDPIPGGGLQFDGGAGTDTFAATADVDFVANNGQVTIGAFGTVDLVPANVEVANLTGGAGANMFTVADWNDITLNLDGAGVGDTYDVTFKGSGASVINVNDTGVAGSDKLTVHCTGGDDLLDLNIIAATRTLARGSEKVTYAGIEELTIDGAGGNDKLTVDFSGGDPLTGLLVTFDGGAGTADEVEVKANADFELRDNEIKVAGSTLNLVAASVELITLTGGAAGNQFLVEDFTGFATLNGGDGNDTFTVKGLAGGGGKLTVNGENNDDRLIVDPSNGDPIPGGGITYDGGAGTDTVASSGDANYTLTNAGLTVGAFGVVSFVPGTVEVAELTGGAAANKFDLNGWTGNATLNGLGGDDSFTIKGPTGAAGVVIAVNGGADDDLLTLDFSGGDPIPGGGITYDGGSETDKIVAATDANFTLSDASLVVSTAGTVTFVGTSVEVADLTGGASSNQFNVTGWTGSATLNGQAGDDSFTIKGPTGGAGSTIAVNGEGDDDLLTLDFSGGSDPIPGGDITFNGGAGTDTVTNTSVDTDFTLSDAGLVVAGFSSVNFSPAGSVEVAVLNGGNLANQFDLDGWTGTATLNGLGGDDSFTIRGPTGGAGSSIDVNGGANNDLLTLDFTGGDPIPGGGVDFDGSTGTDKFVAATNADFDLSNAGVNISTAGTVTFVGNSVEAADLTGGASNNDFHVSNWGGTADLDGAGGNDTYQIDFKGSGAGTTLIGDTGGTAQDAAIANLSAGGDAATLATVGGLSTLTFLSEKLQYGASLDGLTVNGLAGNDVLTINLADGNPIPVNNVTFDGGTELSADLLRVVGRDGNDDFNVKKKSLLVNGSKVKWLDNEQMELEGGDGTDTFRARKDKYKKGLEFLTLLGNGGNDTFLVAPAKKTRILIDGGSPVRPIFPGDVLKLSLKGGVVKSAQSSNGHSDGIVKFRNREQIEFFSIESGNGAGVLDLQ